MRLACPGPLFLTQNEGCVTTMLCYAHACTCTLPRWPVAGELCVMMLFPPCQHALHGRKPSCILHLNVHICSLHRAGHSSGVPVAGPRAQAPASPRGAPQETTIWPRCIACTSSVLCSR